MTTPLGPWSTADEVRAEGGGKAAHLHRLARAAHRVPDWFCVPASLLDEHLKDAPPDADLGRYCVERAPPPALARLVREGLERLHLSDAMVAVRSSGLDEDSAEHSFAGQFESFLYQCGEARVVESVQRCWASAFSARNTAYRAQARLGDAVRMGIVVQRMVDSETAGVAFSRNPFRVTDRDSVIVESVWGQGEGLVSGELTADRFAVRRGTLDVVATIAEKTQARRRDPAGGTVLADVPAERRSLPSLTDEQAREVARLAIRLEQELGTPQDCEWAYADGALHVLQTRPITTLPPPALFDAAVNGDVAVIWDNSNIIESFAGVTTPLTFTHAARAYEQVYRQTARMSGVPERVLAEHDAMFRNMLGLIRGRVYYNLLNWYRLLGMFPLLGRSRGFMDTMMGVKQSLTPELAALFDPLEPPRYSAWRRLRVLARLGRNLMAAERENEAFVRRIMGIYRPLEREDLSRRSYPELLALYRTLEREVLAHWTAPIVNDTRCMLAFGTLKALTDRWLAGADAAAASLQNDLLCGEGDLKSTEPTRMLIEIARAIDAADPAMRDRIRSEAAESVWEAMRDGFAPQVFQRLRAFLDEYGFRCVNEQKLEEPDLHEQPYLAVAIVQGYLRHGVPSPEEMAAQEAAIRDRAEGRARAALRGPKRWVYFRVLRWARRAISDRERLRFERTRTFGVTRRMFRAMGAHLARLGFLDDAADVFYLELDELFALHEGRATGLDLRGLAAVRRRQFDEYRRTPAPPDRFMTRGVAGSSLRYPGLLLEQDLLAAAGPDDDPSVLRGTPCSPGVVEGEVLVAERFEDAAGLNGQILVTERTDPGWVPLFPACAGLIIERGSLLSHSAVVARELGVPTIVGMNGRPMERLRTGLRVRMDAGTGEVRIL